MALSIHPLDLGDLELDNSFVNWQTGCGTKGWFATTAYPWCRSASAGRQQLSIC
jgi:hypothetical protein